MNRLILLLSVFTLNHILIAGQTFEADSLATVLTENIPALNLDLKIKGILHHIDIYYAESSPVNSSTEKRNNVFAFNIHKCDSVQKSILMQQRGDSLYLCLVEDVKYVSELYQYSTGIGDLMISSIFEYELPRYYHVSNNDSTLFISSRPYENSLTRYRLQIDAWVNEDKLLPDMTKISPEIYNLAAKVVDPIQHKVGLDIDTIFTDTDTNTSIISVRDKSSGDYIIFDINDRIFVCETDDWRAWVQIMYFVRTFPKYMIFETCEQVFDNKPLIWIQENNLYISPSLMIYITSKCE